ncbi:MAG: tyrosine-type recombinase/integrase [Eubacteriales bacterium]|nr:tyrosine-type recombinase/integrase [Eubacteriales bacterium]
MSRDSYNEKNQHYIDLLNELLKVMPRYLRDYIYDIESDMLPSSRYVYVCDLKMFFDFLVEQNPMIHCYQDISLDFLNQLTIQDFNEFLHSIRGTDNERYVSRKVSSIRKFFDYLISYRYITNKDAYAMKNPKIRKDHQITYMDTDEIQNFLANVDAGFSLCGKQKKHHDRTRTRDLAMLSLMLGTGIRVSECTGLDLDDVDLERRSIHIIRKGKKESDIYFSETVKTYLEPYIMQRKLMEDVADKDANALFISSKKTRITPRAVQNLVKKYASPDVVGTKKITPHKLRSSYGTALYEATGDISIVADVLGHESVDTTRKFYSQVTEQRKRRAGDVDILLKE